MWLSEAWAKCYAMTESAGREPFEVWTAETDCQVLPIKGHAGGGRVVTEALYASRLDWEIPNRDDWDRVSTPV